MREQRLGLVAGFLFCFVCVAKAMVCHFSSSVNHLNWDEERTIQRNEYHGVRDGPSMVSYCFYKSFYIYRAGGCPLPPNTQSILFRSFFLFELKMFIVKY